MEAILAFVLRAIDRHFLEPMKDDSKNSTASTVAKILCDQHSVLVLVVLLARCALYVCTALVRNGDLTKRIMTRLPTWIIPRGILRVSRPCIPAWASSRSASAVYADVSCVDFDCSFKLVFVRTLWLNEWIMSKACSTKLHLAL